MKDRPMLFSAPMARALLDGSKTQTRRIAPVVSFDIKDHGGGMISWRIGFTKAIKGVLASFSGGKLSELEARQIVASQFNPYGQPGDRLWVKETHWFDEEDNSILYAADPNDFSLVNQNKHETGSSKYNWKPSIFMPRVASRITLEIVSVRVERLQDISEADALEEGCERNHNDYFLGGPHKTGGRKQFASPKNAYRDLWKSINGPGSWELNPWVWVIEFKKVQP